MDGKVFNIQRFCINDGPGIRTTVFLKGCPLRCRWCHNPESQIISDELSFDMNKCCFCGACLDVCENNIHKFKEGTHYLNREICNTCGKCADICSTGALEIIGKVMSVEEVMQEVLKDKTFYKNSSGGMTVSGGEPLMQFEFVYELLKCAKEYDIHNCVETCGFAKKEYILKIADFTDIFLYDWKLTDDVLHRKFTGVSNAKILENLKAIDTIGSKIILRCPIIPNVNDNSEHFKGIANIANSLKNIIAIEIEPYHSLGENKYKKLSKENISHVFQQPDEQQIQYWISNINKYAKILVKKA